MKSMSFSEGSPVRQSLLYCSRCCVNRKKSGQQLCCLCLNKTLGVSYEEANNLSPEDLNTLRVRDEVRELRLTPNAFSCIL